MNLIQQSHEVLQRGARRFLHAIGYRPPRLSAELVPGCFETWRKGLQGMVREATP